MSFKSRTVNLASRLKKFWFDLRSRKSASENLAKKQVLSLVASRRWPTWRQWQQLPRLLSAAEKKILRISLIISALSCLTIFGWFIVSHRVVIPAVGGEFTEGLVGAPQFVNPLYASASDVDSDLTRLVYSGLFQWSQNNGLTPDLAEAYTVSEDQKTYTIKLRQNARWHNGDPVRSSDVLFTIESIQDPAYHSPLSVSFRGITVSEIDESTVQFVLNEPFAPFLSSLTVGILPSDLWSEIPPKNTPLASLNLSPVGSGPFKFEKYSIDKRGEIKSYTLKRNTDYYGQPAKIERLIFKFYHDANAALAALQNQNVEGLGFVRGDLLAEVLKDKSINLLTPASSQITALFFNEENQPLLKEKNIRKALALSLDKERIIQEVFAGRAMVVDAPILPDEIGYHPGVIKLTQDLTAANALLDQTDLNQKTIEGYRAKKVKKTEGGTTTETLEEFILTITTINQPSFIRAAELIAEQVKAVGIKIQIEVVEPSGLYNEVIKPRAYQILLTATQYGTDPDPYPFWHSSQTKAPGLNLALYANHKVDELLEKARATNNTLDRTAAYQEFQNILADDLPAIFLCQTIYPYALSSKIKGAALEKIHSPADRFQNITEWYIKTKNIIR